MEYASLVLTFHIWGAVVLGALLTTTAIVLYTASQRFYKFLAIALAGNTFQLTATGVAMLALFPEQGWISFCTKMAIYLSVFAIAEYVLIKRLQTQTIEAKEPTA